MKILFSCTKGDYGNRTRYITFVQIFLNAYACDAHLACSLAAANTLLEEIDNVPRTIWKDEVELHYQNTEQDAPKSNLDENTRGTRTLKRVCARMLC